MPQTTQPVIDYTAHLAARADGFTGRGWALRELDEWLGDPAAGRYFLLTGEPGAGKTALAAQLAKISNGTAWAPPGLQRLKAGFLGAIHFCSVRDRRWINPQVFAESLTRQLSESYDGFAQAVLASVAPTVNLQVVVRENWGKVIGAEISTLVVTAPPEDLFDRLVREPLEALGRNADQAPGQVVILVDALDESLTYSGPVKIADLLTQVAELPQTVRFILTSRPETGLLRTLRDSGAKQLSLSPRPADSGPVLQDVHDYLGRIMDAPDQSLRLAPDLPPADFVATVRDRSDGNFLYVRHLLLGLTARRDLITARDLAELPAGLDQIYLQFLERLAGNDPETWQAHYGKILGVLAVAQVPLTTNRIAAFTQLPLAIIGTALARIRQLLEADDHERASERVYALYHRSFAEFLLDRDRAEEFWIDGAAMHRQIAQYYWENFRADWQQTPSYGLRNLATHLFNAGDHERLQELIDEHWIGVRHRRRNYSYDGLLDDLDLAWQSAIAVNRDRIDHGQAPELGQDVRWALSLSSIGSMVSDISAEVLAALVGAGVWSQGQGLAYARRTPAGEPRTRSLAMLAPHLASPTETFAEALIAACRITESDERAETLTWLLPRLPADLRRRGFDEALNAVSELSDQRRVAGGYSSYYGSGDGERFVETGARSRAEEALADALVGLVDPPLPKASIVAELRNDPAGLSFLPGSVDSPWPIAAAPTTDALLSLVDVLPEIGDGQLIERVQAGYRVFRPLAPLQLAEPLVPVLSANLYRTVEPLVGQRIRQAEQLQDPAERADRIAAIAVPAIHEANTAVYGRGYPGWNTRHRIGLLVSLLTQLPEPHLSEAGRCLLERIEEFAEPVTQQDAAAIAWYLPDSLLPEAASAITEVPLPQLMPSARLPLALRIARERKNKDWLMATTGRLTGPLLLEALETAHELGGVLLQAELFAGFRENFAALDREQLYRAWSVTLMGMSELRRPAFLELLLRMQPIVATLGGETSLRGVLDAVGDVGKWWP